MAIVLKHALAQSLQTFEKAVVLALVLRDISEWDGRILKQREQQIRQAAGILHHRT